MNDERRIYLKRRHVKEILETKPRAYPVFRVVSDRCWLVDEGRARVGEEYIFHRNEARELRAAGPLVPGTLKKAAGATVVKPGDLDMWAFLEYRVGHRGQMVGVHLRGELSADQRPLVKPAAGPAQGFQGRMPLTNTPLTSPFDAVKLGRRQRFFETRFAASAQPPHASPTDKPPAARVAKKARKHK